MRKKLYTLAILAASIGLATLPYSGMSNSGGAPAGFTGGGTEGTCATSGCHTGTALDNSSKVAITLLDGANAVTEYTPGKTHTVRVVATDAAITRFGFGASVQNASNAKAGNIVNPVSSNVKTGNNYATHNTATPSGTGTTTWEFQWTAPMSGEQATIYAAVNFANGDFSSGGDRIEKKSLAVSAATVGIGESVADLGASVQLYPNPTTNMVKIGLPQAERGIIQLEVMDLQGRVLVARNDMQTQIGGYCTQLDISNLEAGNYILVARSAGKVWKGQIVKL